MLKGKNPDTINVNNVFNPVHSKYEHVSTQSIFKKLLMGYFTLFYVFKFSKSDMPLILRTHLNLTIFHVLNSHTWVMAILLDTAN